MQVHAPISKEWRRRMTLMGLMLFGSALWFFYDGFIAWPAEAQRHEQLERITAELVASGEATDAKDPAVSRAWDAYAVEHDLKPKPPKERTPGDISAQRTIGGVLLTFGLIFAAWVALQHRKSVRADGDLITGANGERVPLDTIVEIDRRKWNNKGIAYAIYEVDGRRRRLCLDDHKFIGCEAIILEAEKRISARQPTETDAPDLGPDAS